MGRTYKREPDDFDDVDFVDLENDDDVEFEARPNAIGRGERERRAARRPSLSRSLPDDWRDFDYGGLIDTESNAYWR